MMMFRDDNRGFTLIEVIIGIGISAGILFMVGTIGSQFSNVANFVNFKLQNRQNVEQVFQTIVTDVRSMGPSALGGYPIEAASPTSVTFFSDTDKNGIPERVRYFVGTSTINLGITKATGTPPTYTTSTEVVKNIVWNLVSTSTIFEYYNASYTGTQASMTVPIDLSSVRVIKIGVSVDINPGKTPLPTYFMNTVNPRNLRTN